MPSTLCMVTKENPHEPHLLPWSTVLLFGRQNKHSVTLVALVGLQIEPCLLRICRREMLMVASTLARLWEDQIQPGNGSTE